MRSLIAFACSLVVTERLRQIEKGYTPGHDDGHGSEELATAAAIYMLPAGLNPDVAYSVDNQLRVDPLFEMLSAHTFDLFRDDDSLYPGSSNDTLDARITTLTYGLALGLSELERVLRLRHGGELHRFNDSNAYAILAETANAADARLNQEDR